MRIALLGFAAILLLLGVASTYFLGVSPLGLARSLDVATGLGAKIACSGRHISGFSETQVLEDLGSYSPALNELSISYEDDAATASLLWSQSEAVFREGLGCTLNHADPAELTAASFSQKPRSEGEWPLGSSVPAAAGDIQSILDQWLVDDNAQGLNTRALVVVEGERIIAEAYGKGIEPGTPLLGWSMAKSVTAMILGHLEYTGKVSVAETELFAEWQRDARSEISLEQMLQMVSGLEFEENYSPPSDATQMLFTEVSASDYAAGFPLEHAPGSHFAYSSGTANLLAALAFQHMGESPAETYRYLNTHLYQPLSLQDIFLEPDAGGIFVGSSYLYASARDWARLGAVMLNGGELNGYRFLGEDWVRRASSPNNSANDPRYGYQFWLNGGGDSLRWPSLPSDAYAMTGNRGQLVMIIPSSNRVVVRLGWSSRRYPADERFARVL